MKINAIIDQIIKLFVVILFRPVFLIIYKRQVKLVERILFHLSASPFSNNFFSLVVRPKEIVGSGFRSVNFVQATPSMAIVMQGPIQYRDNFTLGSIRLYRSMFPDSKIILSTWSDEDSEALTEARKIGAIVVLDKRPEMSGLLNFNLQRACTMNGLNKAKAIGSKFAIKTRTDQRMNSRHALMLLMALTKKFPTDPLIDCNSRIFFINSLSYANIPFHLSDMFQFGCIDDLLKLWDIPDHKININREKFNSIFENKSTVSDIISQSPTVPEVWLGRHYAEKLFGCNCLEKPSEAYISLLKDAVGIVDRTQLDLYWSKYTAYEEHRDYMLPPTFEHLSFSKWLALESGVSNEIINYDPKAKM